MKIVRYLLPLPSLLRGVGLLLAFRYIAESAGVGGLIEYSFVAILSSVAVTLSAGGSINYLIGFFSKRNFISNIDLKKIINLTWLGLVVLLFVIVIGLIFSRINFLSSVFLWVVVVLLVYFFASLASFSTAFLTGTRSEGAIVVSGSMASILYIFSLTLLYLFEMKILAVWAVLGFHFINGSILTGLLFTKFSNFRLDKIGVGVADYKDMMSISLMSGFSAVSNSIFLYGWINGRGASGEVFTADLISMFRLTDVAMMLIGPFISVLIYPRICGWAGEKNGGERVIKFFTLVSLLSLCVYFFLFLFRDLITEIFLGRTITLEASMVFFFMLGESIRLALSVFGYAFIDSRDIFVYYLIEFFVKILIGFVVYVWAEYFAPEMLFMFYFGVVVSSVVFAVGCTKGKIKLSF